MKLMKRLSRFALALVPLLLAASARADVIAIPRQPWPTEPPEPVSKLSSIFDSGLLLPILLVAALLILTALLVRRLTRKN